jgi:5-methylcytosine-specific restriction endonuclease McrA
MGKPVLVLNASYQPLHVTPAKRALTLLVKGKAVYAEDHGVEVHRGFTLPCVIRLAEYHKVPHRLQRLTRKNIHVRDSYRCQYCGRKFENGGGLTLDHVQPKSRGGKSVWENLVSCCMPCNRAKGHKTLQEANLKLLQPPRVLTVHTSRHLLRQAGLEEAKWRKYLFYDSA